MQEESKAVEGELQEQVKTLATMVTTLSQQVEDLQQTKAQVDESMTADMDATIKAYTEDYLTNNLVAIATPEVSNLLTQINSSLNRKIKEVVERMLRNTPYYL